MANSSITHDQKSLSAHIFSVRHRHSFLYLGELDSTSELCLGAILISEATNEQHSNVKNMALTRLQKELLFTAWELKQEDSFALP